MALRLLTQPILRQQICRVPTAYRLYTTTTDSASTTGSSATKFADSLSKKFIGQAIKGQKAGRRYNTPSKFVIIDDLPSTATTEDIRKLAREAFSQGDKTIRETIFCRMPNFHFFGRVVVKLDNEENARRFVEYGHRRLLGGHTIKMTFAGKESENSNEFMNKLRRPELISVTDATSAAGHSVVFSGLPKNTSRDHLLGILRSKNLFPMESAPDSVVLLKGEHAVVSRFLIKFDSESEAWRCVRAFHNNKFFFKANKTSHRLNVSVAY